MMNLIKTAVVAVLFLSCSVLSASMDYFENDYDFILSGGFGYGVGSFGLELNGDPDDVNADMDLVSCDGTGQGKYFEVNGLLKIKSAALGISLSHLMLDDKYEFDRIINEDMPDERRDKMVTKADGSLSFLDLTIGGLLLTKSLDMGYFHPFIGLRLWQMNYKTEYVKKNGVSSTDPRYYFDSEAYGAGYIAGFKDYSTVNFGYFSLVFSSGLWMTGLIPNTVEFNGDKMHESTTFPFGIGGELGTGIAFENIGLAFNVTLRVDLTAAIGEMGSVDYADNVFYVQSIQSSEFIFSTSYMF